MNIKDPNIPEDLLNRFEELIRIRESRRKQEDIIEDLAKLIKDKNKDFFIPYVIEMINQIDQFRKIGAIDDLLSPMKQLIYLVDLYFSVETGGSEKSISQEQWSKITKLLHEVEMTYFGDIGFFEEVDEPNFNKLSVSLMTFSNYYNNAQLSYDEQTLERFERNCGPFDEKVKKLFGFSVNDAIAFCVHIRNITNKKLTDCNYYSLYPEEWSKLTSKLIERGITDPRKWWDEPELELYKEYISKPGFIFLHTHNEVEKIELSSKILEKIIEFLTYPEDSRKGKVVYYADNDQFTQTPLISINRKYLLCPHFKFLIESFYNRINSALSNELGKKYSQFKNVNLEKKVVEIFKKLFGKEGQVFSSYYVDENRSEQDILIRYKRFYLIIEVKDSSFRAPMRNPLKAFEKIKSDFKKSIQYGYDQCKRVEDKIADGVPFFIYDHKTNKKLAEINPSHINDYFSVIVTQFKYGGIQTNLEELLIKSEEDVYPWSVCVDDLEAFVLILKKLKKVKSANEFIEYLKNREPYHEHLICSDELEMAGYFISNKNDFKAYALSEDTFSTFKGMADMFDAEYQNGLGFENELDIDIKKHYKIPNYNTKFDITKLSRENLKLPY